MRLSRMAAVGACAALMSAGSARAADPNTTAADLRCILAFRAVAQVPQYREAAGPGMFYYIGRIEGRDPDFDLAAGLRRAKADMQDTELLREALKCGAALKAKNETLKQMSRELQPLSGKNG